MENFCKEKIVKYKYTDQDITIDEKVENEPENEELMKKLEIAFPFIQSEANSTYRVPKWAKMLLHQKYTLRDMRNVLLYFNQTNLYSPKDPSVKINPIEQKVSNFIIHDLDIMPFTPHQIEDKVNKEFKDEIEIQIVDGG